MTRPSPRVVYVGRAPSAALAFPCSSCHAEICVPCRLMAHMRPGTHQCRVDLAEAIGLRDISASPLFESSADQPGDAAQQGSTADLGRSSLNSAGGASVSPAFFGDETL
jgi:hypothetical protein